MSIKRSVCVMCTVVMFFLLAFPLISADEMGMLKKEVQGLHDKMTAIYFGQKTMVTVDEAQKMAGTRALDFYTDDVISMPNFQKIKVGKDQLMSSDRYWQDFTFHSMEYTTQQAWSCGNMVFDRGNYKMVFTVKKGAKDTTEIGKYFIIWERQPDKTLKIKLEIWNTDHFMNF